jgi:hypothetical protein
MNRKTFTSDQMKNISKNRNVARCGDRSVRYSRGFKALALRQYNEEGLSAIGIFLEAGFDLGVIGKRTPNRLMNQWNTALRPRIVRQPEESTDMAAKRARNRRDIKTLEAKVAYLEAENRFLAKLRAGKRQ